MEFFLLARSTPLRAMCRLPVRARLGTRALFSMVRAE
jgi:hypothetical protein